MGSNENHEHNGTRRMHLARTQAEVEKILKEFLDKGSCSECGRNAVVPGFKTEEYKNEYMTSGLCQACQERVFGI